MHSATKSPDLQDRRACGVSHYGNNRSFYLFLCDKVIDRYFIWPNLHPNDSRYALPVRVQNLVDMRTGEFVSFTSSTGSLFPLELGKSFQDAEFIRAVNRSRPSSCTERNAMAKRVTSSRYTSHSNGKHCSVSPSGGLASTVASPTQQERAF
jgi:hypothetical protein